MNIIFLMVGFIGCRLLFHYNTFIEFVNFNLLALDYSYKNKRGKSLADDEFGGNHFHHHIRLKIFPLNSHENIFLYKIV